MKTIVIKDNQLKWRQMILAIYFVWGVYHLLRDILQQMEVSSFIADLGHRYPLWCRPLNGYCNFITFPLEIYVIIAVPLIWKRKKIGIPEILVLITLPATVIMWLWP